VHENCLHTEKGEQLRRGELGMPDRGEMGMRAHNALAMRVPTNHATENEGLMTDLLTESRDTFVSYGELIFIFVTAKDCCPTATGAKDHQGGCAVGVGFSRRGRTKFGFLERWPPAAAPAKAGAYGNAQDRWATGAKVRGRIFQKNFAALCFLAYR
jgi:hypothetical protein